MSNSSSNGRAPGAGHRLAGNLGAGCLRARSLWTMAACACGVLAHTAWSDPTGASGRPARNTDWPLLGNNAEMQHYSPLTQINDKTIGKLGLAWSADIPSLDGLVGNPLVEEGVVYQSGPQGRVYANDLRTGRLMWQYDAKTRFEGVSYQAYKSSRFNRGLA